MEPSPYSSSSWSSRSDAIGIEADLFPLPFFRGCFDELTGSAEISTTYGLILCGPMRPCRSSCSRRSWG